MRQTTLTDIPHPAKTDEPYAWMAVGGTIWPHKTREDDVPLYTKPQWQALSDDDVSEITCNLIAFKDEIVAFIRKAEAKLKEKNGG